MSGGGGGADQVVSSNEPCQQCSAYKQIGLTDDTVAALVSVSPANHLSTPVFGLQEMCRSAEKAYHRLSSLSLSLSPSVCLSSLPSSSSLKHRLTLFRASRKAISHYFLCCLSPPSCTFAVTCQLSAAAQEIMNYACDSVSTGAATRRHQP